jgi:hypothetical protein
MAAARRDERSHLDRTIPIVERRQRVTALCDAERDDRVNS